MYDKILSIDFSKIPHNIVSVALFINSKNPIHNINLLKNCHIHYYIDGYIQNYQILNNFHGKTCLLTMFTKSINKKKEKYFK